MMIVKYQHFAVPKLNVFLVAYVTMVKSKRMTCVIIISNAYLGAVLTINVVTSSSVCRNVIETQTAVLNAALLVFAVVLVYVKVESMKMTIVMIKLNARISHARTIIASQKNLCLTHKL